MTNSPPINIFSTIETDLLSELAESEARGTPAGENIYYGFGVQDGLRAALDIVARVEALVEAEVECYRENNRPGVAWSGGGS